MQAQPASEGNLIMPYVAVFPFEDSNAKSESTKLGASISEMMVTALIQSNRFKVIERTQLDKIMEEQALGQTGALDDQTALEVGNILGVNAIVIGSVSFLKNIIELDTRLLNAANGEAITASSSSAQHESQIRDAVNQIAGSLAKHANRVPVSQTTDESKVEKIKNKD
jgi:curli biogenesis system outer membrane secretion channel CsgG